VADSALAPAANGTVPAAPVTQPPAATPAAKPATTPASTTTADAPKKEEAPAREMRLTLGFTNDSWVEIYDSAGNRLYYDVASAGSVQSVSGRGLRVVLGNAAGVTVDVDGKAREIPASAADGEGARFVVNRSGSLSRAR
jgi:cytoskeleton protein RodZ